jgi:hypothetical protein
MSEVYTPFEQRIVDGYLKATYPDEPAAPEPMQVAQAPAQTMTDVPADSGSIREIPRNMFQQALGRFGEALTAAGVQLDKVGLDIPVLGRVTLKDLTVGEAGKVIEDMSYGFMPTRGAGGIGGTSGLKPEAAELLNLPIVGTAAKAAGTVARAIPGALPAAAAAVAAQPTEAEGGVGSLARKIGANVVSTRLPTAVKATENPLTQNLVIGLDAAKADPAAFTHNVNLVKAYPNIKTQATDVNQVSEDFINEVKDNLLYLYDQVPEATRQRSKLWYDGARNIVDRWGREYNQPDQALAGVLAVLSPQKDWFMNVSLAQRVIDISQNQWAFKWDADMDKIAGEIWKDPKYKPVLDLVRNKSFAELESPAERALWLRTFDQAFNPRGHEIVTPEGDLAGLRRTQSGKDYSVAWGSLNEIGKAIAILDDPSKANISTMLGGQHKVRNFYNNIYAPTDPAGHVTIDTHAVAAGLLRPLSGNSREVLHNFGSGVKGEVGPKNSSITGVQGTYGLYTEAYRRAAAERGVLPREMQSITWEAVRGLFPDTFKTAANARKVDDIWLKYRNNELSIDEARNEVFKAAGGIRAPEWEGGGLRSPAAAEGGAPGNAGELPGAGIPGGGAGRPGRNNPAPGNPTSVTRGGRAPQSGAQ